MAGRTSSGDRNGIFLQRVWDDTLTLLRAHARPACGDRRRLPVPSGAPAGPVPSSARDRRSSADPSGPDGLLSARPGSGSPCRASSGWSARAAMLRLVLVQGTSVGGAIAFGAALLPFYFLLSLISGLMFIVGLVLLIVPALYLAGRLCTAGPILVAESSCNPIAAIARSFEITKGQGWALFGLIFLVVIVGIIVTGVATMLTGPSSSSSSARRSAGSCRRSSIRGAWTRSSPPFCSCSTRPSTGRSPSRPQPPRSSSRGICGATSRGSRPARRGSGKLSNARA